MLFHGRHFRGATEPGGWWLRKRFDQIGEQRAEPLVVETAGDVGGTARESAAAETQVEEATRSGAARGVQSWF